MKKKILVFLCMLVCLAGCASAPKADKRLVCVLNSENEKQTLALRLEIDYNSEEGTAIKGVFHTKYDNLIKNETNNDILINLINRQSIVEQVEGVEVSLDVTATSFDYKETWSYNDVDLKSAVEADAKQSQFIEKGKFSVEKIKKYYQKLGYSIDEVDIKEK